jgi:putative sigma-54 modulation protein
MLPTIEIAFEGVKHSDLIEGYIRSELDNLGNIDTQVTSATIVVVPPRAKHFSGDPYRLRVHLTAEGLTDVNVNHDPGPGKTHDAMQIAVRDTFRIVRRRLEHGLQRRNATLPLSQPAQS